MNEKGIERRENTRDESARAQTKWQKLNTKIKTVIGQGGIAGLIKNILETAKSNNEKSSELIGKIQAILDKKTNKPTSKKAQ